MPAPPLRAYLFGAFEIAREGKTLSLPLPSTSRAFLSYLCLYGMQPIPRARLVGAFWAEWPESRARRTLTQTLWQIRRHLPGMLTTNSDAVRIHPQASLWVDVETFREQLAAARQAEGEEEGLSGLSSIIDNLQSAVRLYRGDLLEGFYYDWVLRERENLREQYLEALERLTDLHKAAGRYRQALDFALLLTRADPWRETAHREAMRLFFLLERSEQALEHYEAYRQALLDSEGREPAPRTEALAAEIARRTGRHSTPYLPAEARGQGLKTAQLPLVGRSRERARLLAFLDPIFDPLGSSGGMCVLEGEAGVGKTRLAQEVARDVVWRGGQVLWGQADTMRVAPPYGPLVAALQSGLTPLRANQISQMLDPLWLRVLLPLCPAFAEHFPELSPAPSLPPAQEKERLAEAFFRLLDAWARFTPLVLILEDLHWMDGDTLSLLPEVARRLERTACLIIGTHRGEESRSFPALWERLQAIDRAAKGRLVLERLPEASAGELIRQALGLGHPAPLFEARLYRETQGNPLFLLETLRALYDAHLLRRNENGVWTTPWDESTTDYAELPLPPAVEEVIRRRLFHLSPDLTRTLQVAAVLGAEFDFAMLQAGCNLDSSVLITSIRELVRRHFINETPQNYRFSHDKIRQVTYQDIPPERRVEFHRRIAAVIAENHPDRYSDLAHHLAAGQVWDQAVRAYLAHARFVAGRYSADAALQAFEQARRILRERQPFSPETSRRLEFEIWESSYPLYKLRGDSDNCRAALNTMGEIARALGEPVYHIKTQLLKAAHLHEIDSKDKPAYQTAEAALQLARKHGLSNLEARAWTILGNIRRIQSRYEEAAALTTKALELYRTLGADRQVTESLLQLVFVYRDLGDMENAKKIAKQALAQAQTQNDPVNLGHAHNAFAWITRAEGNHQAEAEHCTAMYEIMHEIGYLYYEGVALNNLSLAYSAMAEYQKSIEAAGKALAVFQAIGHKRGQVVQWLNLSSRYKENGQFDKVRQVLDVGLAVAREQGFADEEARMRMSYAELLTFSGEYDVAMTHLARAAEIADELGYPFLRANVLYRRGQLYMAMENYTAAIRDFRQAGRLYEEADWPDFAHLLQSCEAVCHLQSGNLPEALKLSRTAVEGLGTPLMEACFHHYLVMAADGQTGGERSRIPEEAQAALGEAYRMLQERLKMAPDETARRNLLEGIPLHKAIMAAWAEIGPSTVRVRLPRLDAPTGRPLRDDEWVEVRWTVEAPEDEAVSGKTARRRKRLLRLLGEAEAQGGAPTLEDLANALGVSARTVKRDLAALRKAGHTIRTRGSRA